MFLLQAALGYGLLLIMIFGGAIFIGIPTISIVVFNYLSKNQSYIDKKYDEIRVLFKSVFIAVMVVAILLYLIWKFFLSKIDLTYS